ncbi:MAG: hypothetical protein RLZZ543_2200 [Bacteroidota bacterium]|jgi:crotonobetainyl-CoA:carnitine CoA-transferase CaiB-like acyl-CoA transferase
MANTFNTNTFFSDLVVVELASVLAGPSVGLFFRECGARVIKIENKRSNGDVTRTWQNSRENIADIPAYYASINQGKEIRMLDMNSEEDLAQLEACISEADIVISNFKASAAQRWNVEAHQLRERFPSLIVGQIDAFADAPNRVAYDIVLQAEAGYLSMNGSANEPARLPVAFIDILAGHQLKEGILLALMQRAKTGNGAIVKVDLLEAAVGALANQASNYLMSGMIPSAQGTLHPNIAPYGEWFNCADDKRLVLAVGSAIQFEKLLGCLGLGELMNDARFSDNAARVKHRKALADYFRPVFQQQTREYWTTALHALQVPCGAMLNMEEVFQGKAGEWVNQIEIETTITRAVRTVNFHIES